MKTETVEEFIARGGKIIKCATVASTNESILEKVKSTTPGPTTIVSMEEADLFYGENKKTKKSKKVNMIDLSALPEYLRKKYVDSVVTNDNEKED